MTNNHGPAPTLEELELQEGEYVRSLLDPTKREVKASLRSNQYAGIGQMLMELSDFMVRRNNKLHFKNKRQRREKRHQK